MSTMNEQMHSPLTPPLQQVLKKGTGGAPPVPPRDCTRTTKPETLVAATGTYSQITQSFKDWPK